MKGVSTFVQLLAFATLTGCACEQGSTSEKASPLEQSYQDQVAAQKVLWDQISEHSAREALLQAVRLTHVVDGIVIPEKLVFREGELRPDRSAAGIWVIGTVTDPPGVAFSIGYNHATGQLGDIGPGEISFVFYLVTKEGHPQLLFQGADFTREMVLLQ
jgi:hypothetical protein